MLSRGDSLRYIRGAWNTRLHFSKKSHPCQKLVSVRIGFVMSLERKTFSKKTYFSKTSERSHRVCEEFGKVDKKVFLFKNECTFV